MNRQSSLFSAYILVTVRKFRNVREDEFRKISLQTTLMQVLEVGKL
jgi:hypothetical protein